MAEKQRFIRYMRKFGFDIHENFIGTFSLLPCHQKTSEGNHVLIKDITVCLFSGIDTKDGDLGCVTLYYNGVERKKYCRNSYQAEILKKVFCPKDANEAIKVFEQWHKVTKETRRGWKTIL